MADFICLAMASQYTENNSNQEANNTSFRRSLGSSTLFGRRSSRSAASATTAMNTPSGTRPTSDSSIIAPEHQTTHIRIVPSIENPSRSLVFSIIERDLEAGRIIKIGRFTDRSSIQNHISFKSKVVSRSHCEIWLNSDGKVQLKDTKSSSGTFVNHVRLSPANTESRPVEIRDGDLVQLGVDYQGGYEEIYRSVKMRFEVNRPNQPRPVSYSMSAFNNLRNLTSLPSHTDQPQQQQQQQQQQLTTSPLSSSLCHEQNVEVEECCICLYALAPFQALFVAPCSHSYHFKCIRPLFDSYPGFQCPICRTYSDLDASVAIEAEEVIEKFGLRKSSTSGVATSPVIAAAAASVNAADVVSTSDEDEQDSNDVVDDERHVSSSSSVQPTNVISCAMISPTPEPPLSTTLVACTTSLSGIISSPTSSSNVPILENQASRDFNAGDHRATIIFEDDNNVIQQQQQQQQQHQAAHHRSGSGTATAATNTNRQSNNLVEKIKMAFSNDKRHKSKQRTHSSGSASSDDDIMERSETFYDMPCPTSSSSSPPSSPRSTALQPILSRQSTHYNPLNGILEEASQSAIEGGSSS
ncbi:hypothetical protein V8B55DRAFT_1466371 [Mucor lusitanicus]|uniref:FHA domain-containing protein n=1 Tax=Mucor lusitanicus CBS 277.49 TaxID=747725 RepID=A0A168JHM9_MUCCL|nr:hypothetical protein MUCCIDRAFT_84667 [Mucor lusitanicus CBS 277.49]